MLRTGAVADDQNREESERWMRQADRDLAAARSNAGSGYHEWACFLSQQAAEKALKAFLYGQGERAVIGHSILKLLRRASAYDPSFGSLKDAKRLDEVYIPSRYPNGLEEATPGEFYGAEDAQECISLAERVISHVRERSAI